MGADDDRVVGTLDRRCLSNDWGTVHEGTRRIAPPLN